MSDDPHDARFEKIIRSATVCFLVRNEEILLARKTKHIGAGCWNGYGGEIEAGESPLDAAVRELREESGGVTADPTDLIKIAENDFHNTKADGSTFITNVHFFIVRHWTGTPCETDEMRSPTWFRVCDLPLDEMMPADRLWLPVALGGKRVIGRFSYGPRQQTLLDEGEFRIVEHLD